MQNYKDNLDKDGFTVVRNVFSRNEVEQLKGKLETLIDSITNKNIPDKVNISKRNNKIFSLHKIDQSTICDFNYIKEVKNLKEIIINILGENFIQSTIEAFVKSPEDNTNVPEHQDGFYFSIIGGRGINIWIALTDSDKNKGGIYYYQNSHRLKLLTHQNITPGTWKVSDKEKEKYLSLEKVYPDVSAGDIIIHDFYTIHGSDDNKSIQDRMAMTYSFFSSDAVVDSKMRNMVIKNNLKSLFDLKK
ncbi:phytanoyl-CoA dioxygenase family protein [Halobacteriovorax marinus]|uniref:phytanoyl-CoA dioxygenase family protein n=1 Tax=Halobacteriovorax marinus TaxID=97084 RepID=UPI003A940CB0